MGFSFKLQTEFFEGGGYFRQNSEIQPVAGDDDAWVFSSCARGLKRCLLPLLGEGDEPAEYTVRLYFAELENEHPGGRVFDIKLQGQTVLGGFDLSKEAGGSHRAVVREFPGVKVSRELEIELVPKDKELSSTSNMPLLCGVEIQSAASFAQR
jgi:hypothetical protein